MTKLTDRQVVQIHSMRRAGVSNQEIARTFGLNRNSVSAHLAGDVTYPFAVYQKIGMKAPLVTDQWLTIRQAAPWIPGHPSRARMQLLIRGVSWRGKAIPKLRTKLRRDGKRYTQLPWIRELLSKVYPAGIWICSESLFNSVPLATIAKIPMVRLGWIKGTTIPFGEQFQAARLCVATRVAADDGQPLQCSPLFIHRAARIYEHVDVAVI